MPWDLVAGGTVGKSSRGPASHCLSGSLLTSLGRISEEQPEVMDSDLKTVATKQGEDSSLLWPLSSERCCLSSSDED